VIRQVCVVCACVYIRVIRGKDTARVEIDRRGHWGAGQGQRQGNKAGARQERAEQGSKEDLGDGRCF
jgi:hypothetical protein